MPNIKAVIGANFGSEGKGKVTNIKGKKWADITVRFNGGSQAGHTVVKRNGFKHVFSNITSNAMDGVPTYISEYCTVNPKLLLTELDQLSFRTSGQHISTIYINKNCIVTTPFDIIADHLLHKNSTSGTGFYESLKRSENSQYHINIDFILNNTNAIIFNKLRLIRDEHFLPKVIDGIIPKQIEYMLTDYYLHDIISEYKIFLSVVSVVENSKFLQGFKNIIFEGCQGLLLDKKNKWAPYVAYSNTGLNNIIKILKENSILYNSNIEVVYVSRAYMTRHGNGPFPSEYNDMMVFDTSDSTNKTNQFQGSLRVGYLDIPLLIKSIHDDFKKLEVDNAKCILHMTCIDQILSKKYFYYYNEEVLSIEKDRIQDLFTPFMCQFECSDSIYSE